MRHFLQPFSESFALSLVYWPFMCILLTIPFIIARLIARRRATWGYVIFSYTFVLYLLGLGFIHSLSDARQPSVVLRETVFIAAAYPIPLGC